ncbi:MAG: GNAT family N-acetyltransferase [Paracoccus sp. (in: a-proteobacteria)]
MDALSVAAESPLSPDLDLLFARHHEHCHLDTPPESIHMLDRGDLVSHEITFLVLRQAGKPIAMAALKAQGNGEAELKSMHVLAESRGSGASRCLLENLIILAREQRLGVIRLETGAQDSFTAARALYLKAGFRICPPFGSYIDDPASVFMELCLH